MAKKGIHPEYFECKVTCGGCQREFVTGGTKESIRVDVCDQCHPFWTGKMRIVDSSGRSEKFTDWMKQAPANKAKKKVKTLKGKHN
ncbi:MAG: 50S ribosomal protein L31 [Patescibacteria group bacterium]|nr:50S ribosomal protein L31 [Patescibacteria group bacterium]